MSEHTPGPWRRFGGMVDGYGITSEKEVVISDTMKPYNGLHHQANARLITAAPDLLEALKRLTNETEGRAGAPKRFIKQARQAISKAEETTGPDVNQDRPASTR